MYSINKHNVDRLELNNHFLMLISSYVKLHSHLGNFNNYSVKKNSQIGKQAPLDITLFFESFYLLNKDNNSNSQNTVNCMDYIVTYIRNINLSREISNSPKLYLNKHISIFDNLLQSEEHFAFLYTFIIHVMQSKSFTDNSNYLIFVLSFKNARQNNNWINTNFGHAKKNFFTNDKTLEMICHMLNLKDLSFKDKLDADTKKIISTYCFLIENKKLSICHNISSKIITASSPLRNRIFITNQIQFYEKIKYQKIYKFVDKITYCKEIRNLVVIETLMNKLEIEFCSSIFLPKKNFRTNEVNNLFAKVAIYCNLGSKKILCFRFNYKFADQRKESLLIINNNQNNPSLSKNNIDLFNAFYDDLNNFLLQNCLFFGSNIINLKCFITKYYHIPLNQSVHQVYLKGQIKCLFEFYDNMIRYKLRKSWKDVKINIFHMNISIINFITQPTTSESSLYNYLNYLHKINERDFTKQNFYDYKTIVIDFEFIISGEKKQFALIIPVKDRNLHSIISSKVDQENIESVYEFYLSYIQLTYVKHVEYLQAIFEFVVLKGRIFYFSRFKILGFHKAMFDVNYVKFVLLRFLQKSTCLSACIKLYHFSSKELGWFTSEETAEVLMKNPFFNFLLSIYDKNKTFIELCEHIKNLLLSCLNCLRIEQTLENEDEKPCFYILNKNKAKEHNLIDFIKNNLSQ
ncbi:hypothetical protein COBT_000227 [Conglomerata obtusa]